MSEETDFTPTFIKSKTGLYFASKKESGKFLVISTGRGPFEEPSLMIRDYFPNVCDCPSTEAEFALAFHEVLSAFLTKNIQF